MNAIVSQSLLLDTAVPCESDTDIICKSLKVHTKMKIVFSPGWMLPLLPGPAGGPASCPGQARATRTREVFCSATLPGGALNRIGQDGSVGIAALGSGSAGV